MSIFEVVMLICFGFAWPVAIYKSATSKRVDGKSVLFLYVILTGYIFGMIHKMIYSLDFVIILYFINFCMVFVDLMLYYRNVKLSSEVKADGS